MRVDDALKRHQLQGLTGIRDLKEVGRGSYCSVINLASSVILLVYCTSNKVAQTGRRKQVD
jgi:hypothetical protein